MGFSLNGTPGRCDTIGFNFFVTGKKIQTFVTWNKPIFENRIIKT
jgi:hypothetical protein